MKKISFASILTIVFLFTHQEALAEKKATPLDGVFDSPMIMGAIIAALITVLVMKYMQSRKKQNQEDK